MNPVYKAREKITILEKNMAVPAGITESLMAKIAPYNNIACAITNDEP